MKDLSEYHFMDEEGHPLELCEDYNRMRQRLGDLEAMDAILKEAAEIVQKRARCINNPDFTLDYLMERWHNGQSCRRLPIKFCAYFQELAKKADSDDGKVL